MTKHMVVNVNDKDKQATKAISTSVSPPSLKCSKMQGITPSCLAMVRISLLNTCSHPFASLNTFNSPSLLASRTETSRPQPLHLPAHLWLRQLLRLPLRVPQPIQ